MSTTGTVGDGRSSTGGGTPCPQCGRLPLSRVIMVRSPLQLLIGSLIAVYAPRLALALAQWLLELIERHLTMKDG